MVSAIQNTSNVSRANNSPVSTTPDQKQIQKDLYLLDDAEKSGTGVAAALAQLNKDIGGADQFSQYAASLLGGAVTSGCPYAAKAILDQAEAQKIDVLTVQPGYTNILVTVMQHLYPSETAGFKSLASDMIGCKDVDLSSNEIANSPFMEAVYIAEKTPTTPGGDYDLLNAIMAKLTPAQKDTILNSTPAGSGGRSPIEQALTSCSKGDMTLVQYLVTSGAKITQPMIDDANALGEHDIARYLSEHQS